MDPVSAACFQTGQQAARCPSEHNIVLLKCKELSSCGSLRRTAFLTGISQVADQMEPLQLVQIINSLSEGGLFGLQLLHDVLPAPEHAAAVLQQAACSQDVCTALLASSSWAAVAQGSCAQTEAVCWSVPDGLESVLQLLQSLLMYTFDATATAEAGSSMPTANTTGAAAGFNWLQDHGLQQYVTAVLQALQVAGTQHEVRADPVAGCKRLGLSFELCMMCSAQWSWTSRVTAADQCAVQACPRAASGAC